MKKLMLAALCCMMSFSSFAQEQQMNSLRQRMPQAQVQANIQMPMQMVADTTITNKMDLSPEQLQKVVDLNAAFASSYKSLIAESHPVQGSRMSREDREAFQQKLVSARQEARKQLRDILGDEAYINYLELCLDNQQRMPMGPRGNGRNTQMLRGGNAGAPRAELSK